MPQPRTNITAARNDLGIEWRNPVWGWSARDESKPLVALQIWQGSRLHRTPTLAPALDGAWRYYTNTRADVEAWRQTNEKLGKPPIDSLLGWTWWKRDLTYAKQVNSPVRFILVLYRMPEGVSAEIDDDTLGIRSATYRDDWVGRVTYIDPGSGEYEIAVLRSDDRCPVV